MSNAIKQMIETCSACAEVLPCQAEQPLTQTEATYPMEHASADLFFLDGHTYLAFADCFSGMLWCNRLRRTATGNMTTLLGCWMDDFGYLLHIRMDNGPQFRDPFRRWCQDKGVSHIPSSAYHPESNRHAEQAVKIRQTPSA